MCACDRAAESYRLATVERTSGPAAVRWQQQRLALARALAREPAVLFLDEPTANLDPAATKAIEDIIATVSRRGIKVVMSTHDLGEARRLAGEIMMLHSGRVVETAPAASFFTSPQTPQAATFLAGELLV